MLGAEEKQNIKVKIFNCRSHFYLQSFNRDVQEFLDTHKIIDVQHFVTEFSRENWEEKRREQCPNYTIKYIKDEDYEQKVEKQRSECEQLAARIKTLKDRQEEIISYNKRLLDQREPFLQRLFGK